MATNKVNRAGNRIPELPPGKLMGRATGNALIRFRNALLNLRFEVGDQSAIEFSDQNAMLTLDRNLLRSAVGSAIAMYELQSVQANWLTCRSLTIAANGARTVGGEDILVAKQFKLRQSITSEVIDGLTVNYTYADSDFANQVIRTAVVADDSGVQEQQIVVPRWIMGDIIFAATLEHTGVYNGAVELTVLALEDGRAWTQYQFYTGQNPPE